MQTVTQKSKIVCSIHGDISEYYNNQCSLCVASVKEARQRQLHEGQRIKDGNFENFDVLTGWANPFDRKFEKWTKKGAQ